MRALARDARKPEDLIVRNVAGCMVSRGPVSNTASLRALLLAVLMVTGTLFVSSAMADDTDGDGTDDSVDDCPVAAGNSTLDRTGCPDRDGDGWSDADEASCGTDSSDNSSVPTDTDSDGICDPIDSDDDGDGWSDTDEASCNTDSADNNSIPTDTDSDGICNPVDSDDDGDSWSDSDEASCGTDSLNSSSIPTDHFSSPG